MTDVSRAPRPSQRERRKNRFMTLTGVLLALYTVSLFADIVLDLNLFWLTAFFIIAMTVCAFGWARSLDEAKLNAHYEAWYWGGSLGLLVSGLIFVALVPMLLTPGSVEALFPPTAQSIAANMSFIAGLMLGMTPAVIGYLIWWGVLWARRG